LDGCDGWIVGWLYGQMVELLNGYMVEWLDGCDGLVV
jgi:hypothetical protein